MCLGQTEHVFTHRYPHFLIVQQSVVVHLSHTVQHFLVRSSRTVEVLSCGGCELSRVHLGKIYGPRSDIGTTCKNSLVKKTCSRTKYFIHENRGIKISCVKMLNFNA